MLLPIQRRPHSVPVVAVAVGAVVVAVGTVVGVAGGAPADSHGLEHYAYVAGGGDDSH